MHIRHYRDVFEDEREAGDIVELPLRAVLDWHAARPHLQWGASGLAINVVRFCHWVPLKDGRGIVRLTSIAQAGVGHVIPGEF